jgi:hypothetical protein
MDNFQTGTLAILFTSLRIRVDNLVMELADSLLQPTMALETQKTKWFRMQSRWRKKSHTIHTSL